MHVGACCSNNLAFEKLKAPKKRLVFCLGNFPPDGADDSYASKIHGEIILYSCVRQFAHTITAVASIKEVIEEEASLREAIS